VCHAGSVLKDLFTILPYAAVVSTAPSDSEQHSAASVFEAQMAQLRVEIALFVDELFSPQVHAARLELAKVHFAVQGERQKQEERYRERTA
jgi:hypothetical protein